MQYAAMIKAAGGAMSAFEGAGIGANQATSLIDSANAVSGASQRSYETTERQKALVESRARAVAGASGAGAGDVSVVNDEADIGRAGEYAALTDLYNGKSQSDQLRYQAKMTTYASNVSLMSGGVVAAGDLASGTSNQTMAGIGHTMNTWLQKFGGQMPSWMGGDSGDDTGYGADEDSE